MSHEIRTPLNAVIGFAGLLAESGRLDGDLRRYAELAATAGANLRTVVDDILDFSSVEAGAINLDPEPVALRPLVDACLGIVEAPARAKGLDLVAQIDAAVPDRLGGGPRGPSSRRGAPRRYPRSGRNTSETGVRTRGPGRSRPAAP